MYASVTREVGAYRSLSASVFGLIDNSRAASAESHIGARLAARDADATYPIEPAVFTVESRDAGHSWVRTFRRLQCQLALVRLLARRPSRRCPAVISHRHASTDRLLRFHL
jgi:hypothetical protein